MVPKPITLAEPMAAVTNQSAWEILNQTAGGHPDFTAVEIKSFYVFGLIEDICESVEWLLRSGKPGDPSAWPNRYLPAFGVLASGIDLLGRCLTGNTTHEVNENLRVGFYFLANPTSSAPPKSITATQVSSTMITTSHMPYSVSQLIGLRNYAAHGQAASKGGLPGIDNELLAQFPPLMGVAMETYWAGLINDREYCLRLGTAEIGLYSHRVEPLADTLRYYGEGGNPIDMFGRFNWRVLPK